MFLYPFHNLQNISFFPVEKFLDIKFTVKEISRACFDENQQQNKAINFGVFPATTEDYTNSNKACLYYFHA